MWECGRARTGLGIVGLVVVAAALASCGTSKDIADMTCPRVIPAPGTDRIVLFGPGGHDTQDVVVGGRIVNADVTCQREKPGVEAMTVVHFYAERANGGIADATLPYFVALLDPQQRVLTQEGFRIDFKFFPGESYRKLPNEDITVHLPVHSTATAGAYTIVVGFQLTPEQLAFNRTHGEPTP